MLQPTLFNATSLPSFSSGSDPRIHVFEILEPILRKKKMQRLPVLFTRVRLNEFQNLSEPEFHYLITRYHARFASICNISISFIEMLVESDRVLLKGRHETGYGYRDFCRIVRGNWEIEFHGGPCAWTVASIQIGGVEF